MTKGGIHLLSIFCFCLLGCSSGPSTWPERVGVETDEEERFVDYGGPIREMCTGRHAGSLFVTIVDSSSGQQIDKPLGKISAGQDSVTHNFTSSGTYLFQVAPRDSIFIRVLSFQRRKFILSRECTDSVVVPLASRYYVIWN